MTQRFDRTEQTPELDEDETVQVWQAPPIALARGSRSNTAIPPPIPTRALRRSTPPSPEPTQQVTVGERLRAPERSVFERLASVIRSWFAREPEVPATSRAISIASRPSGATTVLVTDGRITLLGVTPLVALVDATRDHDLVVAKAGHAIEIRHLVPVATHHVVVVLRPR
jgi:hypothetical protein